MKKYLINYKNNIGNEYFSKFDFFRGIKVPIDIFIEKIDTINKDKTIKNFFV